MKLGTDEFGKVFLGDEFVERIYQGDDQIYSIYKDPKDSEIVFRPTDNKEQLSVDDPYFGYAKIDCLKGKSLVWNQLVHNGNFADGITGWGTGFGTASVDNNIYTYSVTEPTTSPCVSQGYFPDIANHKYLFVAELNYSSKPTYNAAGFLGIGGYYGAGWNIQSIVPNSWFKVSGIATSTGISPNKNLRFYLRTTGMSAGDTIKIKNVIAVDLTLMFGSGNEPSTVAEFEAMFPLPYYEYNPGTLISNDAETLETVGFNQIDLSRCEFGTYNQTTGALVDNASVVRCGMPVVGGSSYYIKIGTNLRQDSNGIGWYDGNHNYLGNAYYGANIVIAPSSAAYGLVVLRALSGIITLEMVQTSGLCINLSDTSKNGTYESYWRASLPLGLDYLPIKSHNIWDEEWESGTLGITNGKLVKVSYANVIRSKNLIPVFPNSNYFVQIPDGKAYVIGVDDEDGNNAAILTNGTNLFTTGNRTKYIAFSTYTSYPATYNYDICINISDPDFNGQYEPYALRGGLKGAGTAYDLGRVEDDGYIHEVTKVMGEVDLGKLTWTYVDLYGIFASSVISDMYFTNNNVICERYITAPIAGAQTAPDKSIYLRGDLAIGVKDSAYTTDATAFKTAMNRVYAYYELATPITYELVTPIPAIYRVDKRGTEQATFPAHSDGSPSAPLCAEIGYPK